MKNSILLFCLLVLCLSRVASAQSVPTELVPGYYVVVGAYAPSREANAKSFVELLNRKGHKSDYGFNKIRNLFFVYINYYNNLKDALQNMEHVRETGKFVDAWVRVVPGAIKTETTIVNNTEAPEKTEEVVKVQHSVYNKLLVNSDSDSTSSSDSVVVADNDPAKQPGDMTLGNTKVFLNLYHARNNRIVDGDVQIIDSERSRRVKKVKGNEYLTLPDPKSKSGQLTLICEVFGYRKIQEELMYPIPLADTVKPFIDLVGNTMVINFDLVRYHKGDIVTLYNVYFFNDAAIMTPDSKFELNELLLMMTENSQYKIRLHGHANGNFHGKIISMGGSTDFFSLKDSKETMGSAKDLSQQRAEIIKAFLVSNGVDPLRVDIKAWGGRRPLYDKKGVNAKQNVRVEVEILSE